MKKSTLVLGIAIASAFASDVLFGCGMLLVLVIQKLIKWSGIDEKECEN